MMMANKNKKIKTILDEINEMNYDEKLRMFFEIGKQLVYMPEEMFDSHYEKEVFSNINDLLGNIANFF